MSSHNPITCAALSCAECDSADVVTVPDALEAASRLRERAERGEMEADEAARELDEHRRNSELYLDRLRQVIAERNGWRRVALSRRSPADAGTIAGLRFRLAEAEDESESELLREDLRALCADYHDLACRSEDQRAENARITQERAQLTAEIERLRARQSGEHYARVMDVVTAARAWANIESNAGETAFNACLALEAAVRAYERVESEGT